ncbi:uncharacterized protein LOC143347906 [Colletes latitarsis]|uniref:uncharacterized protein LOC143347906 n=1 Tax=Colletes latitarsis TaxID=2605962 RepID=UPI00403524A8
MSVNVTVNGNLLSIRRGRMVLSDLDQIKKNERDRRRRLRLEQVRQQSKEISDRLLERAKTIARQELKKLDNNDKLNSKQVYDGKILEIQQKYQEDMADIGQAHISAILEPDHNELMQEREKQNKLIAAKRGKEATRLIRNTQEENAQWLHQDRLRKVRELENIRSTMVAKLPRNAMLEKESAQVETDGANSQSKCVKKKQRKGFFRKSPGKITKSYVKVALSDFKTCSPRSKSKTTKRNGISSIVEPSTLKPVAVVECDKLQESEDKDSGRTESVSNVIQSKVDKISRYNPEDYVQSTSNSIINGSSDSSSSFSEDSSFVPDTIHSKCIRQSVNDKVQMYDHSKHHCNTYNKPVGVVEKIHVWNEPNAIDLAQEIEQAQSVESHLAKNRKSEAQKRGEDAVLREKVRRDYQALVQNLNHLACEERKLKASHVKHYLEDTNTQVERRKVLQNQHKKKINRTMKALLDEECLTQCSSYPVERQITLKPRENDNVDVNAVWENHVDEKIVKNDNLREEQILDMLKKVEKQKQLLLQEFGADLPDDVFNATVKPLFEKERSSIQKSLSPEIKVINTSCNENKTEEKQSPIKRVEIAVQTTTGDKQDIVQDKSIQVELIQEKQVESNLIENEISSSKHHPLEPKITVATPADESESSSIINEIDEQSSKETPIKQDTKQKLSPAKKFSKTLPKSRCNGVKKLDTVTNTPSKKIKIYVNQSGFDIKVNPPQVVDVSTQSSRIYSTEAQEKLYSIESREKQMKTREISDTSTSFASPPPIKPRDILEALNNISILEMLDSSANESLRRLKRDVSPVSTPETPSPRTMGMPSNVPRLAKINRMLRYASADFQINDSSIPSSKNDGSTSTNLSNSGDLSEQMRFPKQPIVSVELCSCENPECKLTLGRFDNIRNYALKNCPQILQKYEDLQNLCTERIVSLTNLIEKVRSEQKGVEFSIISAGDETSLMQLPSPKLMPNDLENVKNLVENIEAIHDQLTKTLLESQRVIKDKTEVEEKKNQDKESVLTKVPEETPKNIIHSAQTKAEAKETKAKPKIINEERVNIQLDRYKIQYKPQTMATSLKTNSQDKSDLHDEVVIEKLSKEILEQSKSFKNDLIATKECETRTSTDTADSKTDISLKQSNQQSKEDRNFVPLLSDIPKLPRSLETVMLSNGRSKPPVSLLSGPYRTEIESSGHELSTIIEFDTPDTVTKSPLSTQKVAEAQINKVSFSNVQSNRFKKSYDSSTSKQSSEEATTFRDSSKLSKKTESRAPVKPMAERREMESECDGIDRLVPVSNELGGNEKDRMTSTSSNSFSGLSGISQIVSTPSSDVRYPSSPEEMETALKKLGLDWAITTLKKTREASALSSSSNSDDRTPMNAAKRTISPAKKQFDSNYGLPDFSDVSSISIKDASKSTEQAVLLKGRTSTPKLQNSNSNSTETSFSITNASRRIREQSDGLIIPDLCLTNGKSASKKVDGF